MVQVKLHNVKVTGTEKQIALLLVNSIERDISGLVCTQCAKDSQVILHVDNSKISVLRTEIKPCCKTFEGALERSLFEIEPA